jgi:hypothetical protein
MKLKYYRYILLSYMAIFTLNLSSSGQNVIITDDDTNSAHSSAMLDVNSLDKGFLMPRLTQTQRDAISSPAEGLLIYQTDNIPGIYIYQSGWRLLGGDLGFHTATQNLALNDNWLSNDGDDEGIRVDSTGKIGIGILPSYYGLDVDGEITSRNKSAFRLRQSTYSAILRNDNYDFYILLTDSGDPDGNWSTMRPFRIYLDDGAVDLGNHSLHVKHGGNVGIKETDPNYTLDVNGNFHVGRNGDNSGVVIENDVISSSNASSRILMVENTSLTYGGGIRYDGSANKLYLFTRNASATDRNALAINRGSGNIGIGGVEPTAKLTVKGDSYSGDTLFAVKDQEGNNVFIVYPDAVQVIVPTDTKDGKSNKKGAFLVSGRGSNKSEANFMDMTKENYFLGYNAGYSNTTGNYNQIMGYESGYNLSVGDDNTFIGYRSGYSNTNGKGNVFFGKNAGYSNLGSSNPTSYPLQGNFNVFIGENSGYSNTRGGLNVFIGNYSGWKNITGENNTYLGTRSGLNNTGSRNVILGTDACYSGTSADESVFIGRASGYKNSGNGSVFIGHASGYNSTSSYSVFIGHDAGYNETNSNRLYIDNSSTSAPLIWGDFGSNTVNINGKFAVNNSNPSYSFDLVSKTAASSSSITYAGRFYHQYNSNYARGVIIRAGNTSGSYSGSVYFIRCADYDGTYVGNIYSSNGTLQIAAKAPTKSKGHTQKSTKNALDIIKNLQVVDYKFDTKNEYYQTGFIAEDAQQYFPEMVNYDEAENEYSIAYSTLVPLLTKALQEQQAKMEAKDNEIENLKTRLEAVEQFIQNQNK